MFVVPLHKTRIALLLSVVCLFATNSRSQTELATEHAHSPYTCVHEIDHLPTIDPQADQLYRYGQYLESKLPSRSYDVEPDRFNEIARYYRLAAAYGNYHANLALRSLAYQVRDDAYDNVSTPWRKQREEESERLLNQLVAGNIPAGFVWQGNVASQNWNLPAALSYYRKAADLGSPDAQFEAAEILNPSTIIGAAVKATQEDAKVADSLYRCAAEQGYGKALWTIADAFLQDGRRDEAIQVYQKGVAAGDEASAFSLQRLFAERQKSDGGTSADTERARRYEAIRAFLAANQNANATVPDVEKIVPLPPAPLPAWNGTFQWALDDAKAKVNAKPPARPPEQLINRLSKAKNLDPHTGLPPT